MSSPTATVFAFITRKPGTTLAQMKSYYEDKHIPWVTNLIMQDEETRPISWTRNYVDRVGGDGSDGVTSSFPFGGADTYPYDCVTQLVFRDARHRDNCLQAFGKYAEEIAEDEARFLDRTVQRVVFVHEAVRSFEPRE